MTRRIEDPEIGKIDLPDTFVDTETFEERITVARQAVADRLWPSGERFECPRCGEDAFEGRDDLTYRITQGNHVISFRHLHGASCSACGAKTLEPYEQIAVEEEGGVGFKPDYEAKVSRIGSGSLGTYWPKDVQRVLNLEPHKKAFIEIIDRDAVIVRFEDAAET